MKIQLKSAANLGWQIDLDVQEGATVIRGNLAAGLSENAEDRDEENELKASGHALESFVLALACENALVNQAAIVRALDTSFEAILNNFD
jgi:hypothetical protein